MYRRLLRYNVRICAGLGPWLIVVPVASTMLVLFGLMSLASMVQAWTPAAVLETLGPVLLAFVGANLLRPEYQYNSLETILTRPISFRAILGVRLFFAALGVLALQALLCLYLSAVMHLEFSIPRTMFASAVSTAFLGSLAVAVAAAWRSPTLGIASAAALWALDFVSGPRLNPMLTLRGYALSLARPDELWDAWLVGKGVLAVLTVLLLLAAGKAARQPTVQRTARRVVRSAIAILLIALLYTASGAGYKVHVCRTQEAALLNRSRMAYRQSFAVYGPMPVAYLFGPVFARFVGYRAPWTKLPPRSSEDFTPEREYDLEQLKTVALGHPDSIWADNALYELGRAFSQGSESPTGASEAPRFGFDCLETLAGEHPESPFTPLALERLAYLYDRFGQRAKADEAGRRLLSLYPSHEAAARAAALLLERYEVEERPEDALWVAEKLARSGAEDGRPEALIELGCALSAAGRRAEAEQRLNEAVEAATALIMGIRSDEKSLDDIDRLRKFNAARRRALEELEVLRGGQ